jgi:hypothetical protein
MMLRLCLPLLALWMTGCGMPARESHVSYLPASEKSDEFPESESLETIEVPESEWKQIVLERRAKPCDRRAKYVGNDGLALLRETLQALPQKGYDVDCDESAASITVNGKKLDVDFVRAEVGTDAKGKGTRFQAMSGRTGVLVDGLLHKSKVDRDGVVVTNIRRYMPQQLGAIYFWQKDDRYELFITGKSEGAREGVYVTAPLWDGDVFRVGIARFRVTPDE